MLRTLMHSTIRLLVPPACYGCEAPISSGWICDECRENLQPRVLLGEEISPIHQLRAAATYIHATAKAIETWKFSRMPATGEMVLSTLVDESQLAALRSEKYDVIVPVPPNRLHLRERGFDPVAQLANHLHMRLGLPVEHLLSRSRRALPQVGSTGDVRRKNVIGAFTAVKNVSGSVLLIDDVCTTGSTLRECAKVLTEQGCSRVDAFVIAMTPDPSQS